MSWLATILSTQHKSDFSALFSSHFGIAGEEGRVHGREAKAA